MTTQPLLIAPKTYADALTLAKGAQIVAYHRALGTRSDAAVLMFTVDDYAADRRTCITLHMASEKAGRFEIRTLCGYDKTAHRWGEYCAPAGNVSLPDKRGQGALSRWCVEQSEALRGYPGATEWAIYRPAPIPAVSHVMAQALTF